MTERRISASYKAASHGTGDVRARLVDLFRQITDRLEATQLELEQLSQVRSDILATLSNGLGLTYREIAAETGLSLPRIGQITPDGTTVSCGECGTYLIEPSDIAPDKRTPCPVCGSTNRSFGITMFDTITTTESPNLAVRKSPLTRDARSSLSLRTVKRLFAESGNVCAFPGCETALSEGNGGSIGQIVHIRAASSGGPRYDPSLTFDELNDHANLLILCPAHHAFVDEGDRFDIATLRQIKREHRERVRGQSLSQHNNAPVNRGTGQDNV